MAGIRDDLSGNDMLTEIEEIATGIILASKGSVPITDEIVELSFDSHVKRLEAIRCEGNEMFAQQNWTAAKEKYSKCIGLCVLFPKQNKDHIVMLAHSNRAEARLRLEEYEGALTDADTALQIEPKNVKNLFRRGKAAHGLGLFEKACEAFKCALQESQREQSILKLLRESSVAYKQSRTGKYDLTNFFSRGCAGEVPPCADFVGPVEIRRAGYDRRGRGLFATKSLEPGELLLVSNPLAVVRAEQNPFKRPFSTGRVPTKLFVDLAKGVMKSRRQMARLHSLGSDGIPPMEMFRPGSDWMPPGAEKQEVLDKHFIVDIARKKRFEYLERDGPNVRGPVTVDTTEVTGLWILPAFAKHSCAPNCQHSFVGDTIFFRASGHIMEGEQLTVPYFNNLHDNVAARQAHSEKWMFTCKCERCVFEESLQSLKKASRTDWRRLPRDSSTSWAR